MTIFIQKRRMPVLIRVIIADDHVLFRNGLRSLLETLDYIKIIGESDDGQSTIELAESLQPDLVLMDIAMPGYNGLEAAREIKSRFPQIKILVISMHTDRSIVRQSIQAGVEGYIFKGAPFHELRLALESIANDTPFLSPVLLGPILDDYKKLTPEDEARARFEKLTQREKEIFELIVQGLGRQEVAEQLFISPKTVDRHKLNIKEKLGLKSDLQLQSYSKTLKRTR